jgi:dihydrofolate reductase
MKVVLIAAMDNNRVIGVNNTLPWKLSADLKRFKALTMGHTIVMGRNTFESLGRPLPGRRHICVSRSANSSTLSADDRWPNQVFWSNDLNGALAALSSEAGAASSTVYVIGGAQVYTQALAIADELEITHIKACFSGDAFFPEFETQFEKTQSEFGSENDLAYEFAKYSKRSNNPTHNATF